MSGQECCEGSSPRAALWISRSLFVAAAIAQVVVAIRFWSLTWDDSAITLGFARTFAATGRIEPTPGSGVVEGYSTTLWMLLMAGAAKVLTSPAALLAGAKIVTLLLNVANLVLIRKWFKSWAGESTANLVAGVVGFEAMFYETINGMETPLIMTLVLVTLVLLPRSDRASRVFYLLCGALLLLTRWEAAWLLVPFLLVEFVRTKRLRGLGTWAAVFAGSNLLRWMYFGSLLPNTIIAKQRVPYSLPSRRVALQQHLLEPVHLLLSIKLIVVLFVATVAYDLLLRSRKRGYVRAAEGIRYSWQLSFVVLFTVFSLILSLGIGRNWGPPFRSFYSAWPFLIFILIVPLMKRTTMRGAVIAMLCVAAVTARHAYAHMRDLHAAEAPVYMPQITVDNIGRLGTLVSQVQEMSHRPSLTFAGPDMGGVMLNADHVRVVDLGLLCDRMLAREGFVAIGPYVLDQRRPDLIATHTMWTAYAGFERYPEFFATYRPVYFHGVRFFMSRRLIADVGASRFVEESYSTGAPQIAASEIIPGVNVYDHSDADLNRRFATYLILR